MNGTRRAGRPRKLMTPNDSETISTSLLPVKVSIELEVSFENLAEFQSLWESNYAPALKELALLTKATLTIPPRLEEQVVELS